MATYFLFGKYSNDSISKVTVKRTEEARNLVRKAGGEVKSFYSLLGPHDLVMIADFPGNREAMKASVALAKSLGISFSTEPALSIEDFDKLATET